MLATANALRGADGGAEPPARGSVADDGAVSVPDTSARREDATRSTAQFETRPTRPTRRSSAMRAPAGSVVVEANLVEGRPSRVGEVTTCRSPDIFAI